MCTNTASRSIDLMVVNTQKGNNDIACTNKATKAAHAWYTFWA